MITMSGSVKRKATVERRRISLRTVERLRAAGARTAPAAVASIALPSPNSARALAAHESFELGGRPVDRFLDRAPGLRRLADHLGHDRLAVDLHRDLRRCRERGGREDLLAARRVVVERPLRRAFLGPGLEVVEFRERRDVVALARGDLLLDRGALRQVREQALRRRPVLGELPDAPEIRQGRLPAGPWAPRRGGGARRARAPYGFRPAPPPTDRGGYVGGA